MKCSIEFLSFSPHLCLDLFPKLLSNLITTRCIYFSGARAGREGFGMGEIWGNGGPYLCLDTIYTAKDNVRCHQAKVPKLPAFKGRDNPLCAFNFRGWGGKKRTLCIRSRNEYLGDIEMFWLQPAFTGQAKHNWNKCAVCHDQASFLTPNIPELFSHFLGDGLTVICDNPKISWKSPISV